MIRIQVEKDKTYAVLQHQVMYLIDGPAIIFSDDDGMLVTRGEDQRITARFYGSYALLQNWKEPLRSTPSIVIHI
jgi:hypothetical protein